ncbi:MAG: DUF368 domain-containing protein [Oscillospiraceae bacterium]|nr:DUF368 domain-containing protein [Oscillospiraceae bacterium]
MKNLLGIINGAAFGLANVIPGFSGGTMLVIFGCYDKVCGALALDFKAIKKNLVFLCFFAAGVVGGVVGAVFAITSLFENFPVQTSLFFIGLILGGLPLILKLATAPKSEGEPREKFKPMCIVPFLLGLGLVVGLFMADKYELFGGESTPAMPLIALYGAIAAIAMVIPGVSGSFMLVAFGVYNLFMDSIKNFLSQRDFGELAVIIPAGIGILIGLILGARLILFLMKRFKLIVYSAIIGMVVGSVVPMFPIGFGLNLATLIGIICFAAGSSAAFMLGRKEAT